MPDYTIKDPTTGRTLTVRGDSPPTEVELEQLFASAQPQASHAQEPPAPHPNQALYDQMQGVGKWLIRGPLSPFLGGPLAADVAENPGATLAGAALGPAASAAKVVPGILARGLGVSSARAGQNLQSAATAAKGVPVVVDRVGQEGLRAMELQAAGASMPRAATQFMKRITDPTKGELTFEEARDFYSNLSRLSANDYNRLNPTMQRQINHMREALHTALVESAETVGKGGQYASGIREYARAAKFTRGAKTAAKIGAGAAGAGIVGKFVVDAMPSH